MEMVSILTPGPSLSRSFSQQTRHPSVISERKDLSNQVIAHKLIRNMKNAGVTCSESYFVGCASVIQTLSRYRMPYVAQELLLEMKSQGLIPNYSTLSAMMLCFADNGLLPQANAIWLEILNSSFVPNVRVISQLMDAYGRMGMYDEVAKIVDEVGLRHSNLLPSVYSLAISCFGKQGQVDLMENTLKKMVANGIPIDSATGNAFIRYYSVFGSCREMEIAYGRLKRSRHLIEEEGIRAMSSAFLKEKQFYRLQEFLRDVGLGRKNVGNLLWNLLLLSYAANFKMKSLQREFVSMSEAGFRPDLTTFNIRALAFSRMALFWDLHLSLEHMRHEKVVPDLVTCGCVVDSYLDRRLGKNLDFALNKMKLEGSPMVLTDPLVFEVLGKGDFHSNSEAFLEFNKQKNWTYRKLVAIHLKKKFRRDQIFWNY